MNAYEKRVLQDAAANLDYLLTFFFHDKSEHAKAIAVLKEAKAIVLSAIDESKKTEEKATREQQLRKWAYFNR